MLFNLDLVSAELADLHPVERFAHDPALDLDRVEVLGPASEPRTASLFIVGAAEFARLDARFARGDAGAFLVLGWKAADAGGADAGTAGAGAGGAAESVGANAAGAGDGPRALLLPPSPALPDACGMLARLLDFRMRLDTWSEGILAAMARDAPLSEVFGIASGMFANPLMLSDAALYFVLIAGSLPADFRDALWTPAIETGVCPTELYHDAWAASSGDAFGREDAFLVPNPAGDGRTYLVRNLVSDGAYHGCFELVDANAPFTHADLALADCFGDLLTMILPRRAYAQIADSTKGPLDDLLAGVPVREAVLEYGLNEIGWRRDDAYYVAWFTGADGDEGPATRAQTMRRIAEIYPRARFHDDGAGHVMIARDDDYPLAGLRARHAAHDVEAGTGPRFRAGFSSLFSDFMLVRTAADQAAFAHARLGASPCAGAFGVSETCFYDDCWFEDLCRRLGLDEDASWLADRAVRELAQADERDGTEHAATALAYLEHGCSATRTAEALFVHRNTLAYRLKRIKAVSGLDLENLAACGADPLRVHLSLRALAEGPRAQG